MIVKPLTKHHFEFLSLKGGCRGSSESTHAKMPHCWKSHALANLLSYSHVALSVLYLFLVVPRVDLRSVIITFPGHTYNIMVLA